MEFNKYIIYVDESGDHLLAPSDDKYPIFVLAFCLFEKSDYIDDVVPNFQQFKFDHFGHDQIILHERDIRKQNKPFEFLTDRSGRLAFMQEIGDLIEQSQMTIISTVIKKRELAEQYRNPHNPYDLALRFCMERAFYFLRRKGSTRHTAHIVVERRGKDEDHTLHDTFNDVNQGLNDLFAIEFASKKANSTGLQIADLVAAPIGRHVLNPDQSNNAWEIIEPKLDKNRNNNVHGWGLKIFP